MELSVTNRNLQFVDDPLFQEGNEIVARFGYVWRFFSVVPTSRSERRHFGLSGAGRLRPEWRRWPQILFWGKGIGLPVELCFKGNGRDGSQLEFGFHIVTSGWTDRMGRCGCRKNSPNGAGAEFADTHNRLSFRCQSVVWFLTLRPGVVPGPVARTYGGRRRMSGGRRTLIQTGGGKSISGRAVRTLECSRPSTARVPATPENCRFGSTY